MLKVFCFLLLIFMERKMKKVLISVAMLLAAATLFAETMTCESEEGTCVYEFDGTLFHEYCTCDGGSYDKINNHSNSAAMPTELECSRNTDADVYCKTDTFSCENDAGRCSIDHNGEYLCSCWGVYSANGAVEGAYTGTAEFSEESCRNKIVELCGTEPATLRDVCKDTDIFNECVNYIKPVETCYGRWSNEYIEGIEDMENEDILDLLAYGNHISSAISGCCQWGEDDDIKEWRTKWECLDSCTDEDCCQTCELYIHLDDTAEDGSDKDADAANTEVPTDGAAPEDTADGDSSVPAEKEESKSDGCSVLFI